jgi:hypothetical protein
MTDNLVAAASLTALDDDSEVLDRDGWGLASLPTVELSISSLLLDDSPRHAGEDQEHIRVLSELEDLPPVLVHGPTRRVIDGRHRIRAAELRGHSTIPAKIFQGTLEDAFVLAVRMNVAHGMPLTHAERATAAGRIIATHPRWSNRMIASVTGVSAGTVAKVRNCSNAHDVTSNTRIGKDGRVRPVDHASGRDRVRALLQENPTASIRAIATMAGVSPSTVHDVQRRALPPAAAHPVQHEQSVAPPPPSPLNVHPTHGSTQRYLSTHRPERVKPPGPLTGREVGTILTTLRSDPVLRLSETGRHLLRFLDQCHKALSDYYRTAEMVPTHCAAPVAELTRNYAWELSKIAAELDRRMTGPAE